LFKEAHFSSRPCFCLQAKKYFRWSNAQSLGTIETVNLIRYALIYSMGSNRKMAIEKLTTRLKNKTWMNPQIKNHKNNHELRLIRPQTQHKNPEHVYLKFLVPQTSSVEKTVNLLLEFSKL
jgi:hypothetical protein